ncbi:MAG: transglutaminase domain-containing protein [Planctomycetota bacterium]
MKILQLTVLLLAILLGLKTAEAQNSDGSDASTNNTDTASASGMLNYTAPKTIEMMIGVNVQAGNGNMSGTKAITVFPTDWPEQKVTILANNTAPFQAAFRDQPGNNKQLILQASLIRANQQVEATIRVRIEKSHIVGPDDPTSLDVPRALPRDVKNYTQSSPYIDLTSSVLKKIVKETRASEPLTKWDEIETYYDWVRDNIEYQNGDLKSVSRALRDRTGDCEEMTSTFIALCRVAKIPARCVWIPNHCYAEFWMQDKEGNGYWFPCQLAGTRNFGSMPEYLPILQKGDRFKVPEKKNLERYLADHLSARRVTGTTDPKVVFIRQLLGDAAKIPAPDQGGAANAGPAGGQN